jgi:hypothetical protein
MEAEGYRVPITFPFADVVDPPLAILGMVALVSVRFAATWLNGLCQVI